MKSFKLFVVSILLSNCKVFAIDAGANLSTQCLASLHTTDSVLTQFSDNSKEHTAKLKEWSHLTVVSKDSTSNQALGLLQKYEKMLNGDKRTHPNDLREWRSSAELTLANLKDSDSQIKTAIFEVAAKITEEANLIKKARPTGTSLVELEHPTQAADPQSENFLKIRLTSLLQIKKGLEAALSTNYKLYFQLRNKFDLDHPFLKKGNSSWDDFVPQIFPFQSVNLGADKNGTREAWDLYDTRYTEQSGGERLALYDTISLAQKQKISILSQEARLNNFLYSKSDWPNFQKALEKYLPIIAKTEDYVGQTLVLTNYPSSSSPVSEFTIESYDRNDNLVTITHASGLRTTEHASQLFKSQIQVQLLKDIQTLILNDKPVLVFINQERHIVNPLLVTRVSMTNLSIAGIKIGQEQSDQSWISANRLQGIPLSIDTSKTPWENEGLRDRNFTIGSLLNSFSDNDRPQVLPLEVKEYSYQQPKRKLFNVNFEKSVESKIWNTVVNTYSENSDISKKSFLEKMDELRVRLEPNGFYRARAFAFIGASHRQSLELETNREAIEPHLANIKNYENPGFFVGLTESKSKRKVTFEKSLEWLRTHFEAAPWYLKYHNDGKQDAVKLVQEILATIQRYNETIPKLQQAYQNNPELSESLTIYFQERLVLLTQLVQKIGDEQKRLEEERHKLELLVSTGLAVAEKYKIPILPVNNFLISYNVAENQYHMGSSNLYKPLSHGDKDIQDLLKTFVNSNVDTFAREFSATPEDFPMTIQLGKQLHEWKKTNNSDDDFSVEVNVKSTAGDDATIKIKNRSGNYYAVEDSRKSGDLDLWPRWMGDDFLIQELPNTFVREFIAFMNQHKALYSQTTDQLIVGYDGYQGRLLGVTREGHIKYTPLKSFPLFWEPLNPGVVDTTENSATPPSIGRGKTITGSSIYVTRERDRSGKLKYRESDQE